MKMGICGGLAVFAAMTSMAAAPETRPVHIAREMMKAMGGEAAWKQPRYLRFDFIVKIHGRPSIERAHLWDRQTGRYRLEDKAANGSPAVILFNVRDRLGSAYVKGKRLEGAAAAKALKGAYRTYRVDIDWLTLPWNWLAPGVHLKEAGEQNLNGQAFDVVEVTVDEPAGTAPMQYKCYVSRKSHLLEHWSLDTNTSLWDWQYAQVRGLQLASDHVNREKQVDISMGTVSLLDTMDSAFLTDPAHNLAMLK